MGVSASDCIRAKAITSGQFLGVAVPAFQDGGPGHTRAGKVSLSSIAASSWGCHTCLSRFKPQPRAAHQDLPNVGHIKISRSLGIASTSMAESG